MPSKTILITGASSGIGAALAAFYASPENTLVLCGRDEKRLDDTAASCRARGATVQTSSFDITDCDAWVTYLEANDSRSPIDLAILNAGLGGSIPKGEILQSPSATRRMANVNFVAPIVGANLLAERMLARGRGHIVFIGSIAESFPLPMAPAYAATKAGLALFSEALRLRLGPRGVVVTLVSPGFVDTPMSRSLDEPRPFLVSADAAVRVIARGIERRKRRIVVPWQFAVIRGFAGCLPRVLLRAVLARV